MPLLPSDWLTYLSDPFAVLGVSVAADDTRASKRYRKVAKILRPDISVSTDPETGEFIAQLFARLVNPGYEKVKQERVRAEALALLRLQVRRMVRDGKLIPQSELARELANKSAQDAEVFYEQAIAQLAEVQYQPLENFQTITEQISELNLVYLKLKMGDIFVGGGQTFIGERRSGLVTQEVKTASPSTNSPNGVPPQDYADRYYQRAKEYMNKSAWPKAIAELKEALKINPNNGDYHSLLGLAYLRQNIVPGAAKPHFRRALQINPEDQIATHFAAKFDIQQTSTNGSSAQPEIKKSDLKKPDLKPVKSNQRGKLLDLFDRLFGFLGRK
ncbi:J domain-containing protein [Phormidesmis priestleyi]